MLDKIEQSVEFIRKRARVEPKVGIILGSGLGDVVDDLEIDDVIEYSEIPNAPRTAAVRH